jgi:hypothetical protein
MKKIIWGIFLVALAFAGCRSASQQADGVMVVDVDPRSTDVLKMETFVDSVRFLPLQTTDESLIRHIGRVFFVDGEWIVADYSGRQIFFFDSEGRFNRKISRQGRGPGEYLLFQTVMLDERKKEVLVYDQRRQKMFYYDWMGNFVRDIPDFATEYYPRDVINLPNGHFLCYRHDHANHDDHHGGVWEMDETGKFVRWVMESDLIHPSTTHNYDGFFYPTDDDRIGLLFMESEEVYHYDGEMFQKTVSYRVDGLTPKDHEGISNEKWLSEISAENLSFNTPGAQFEKSHYIYACWWGGVGNHYYTLLDKRNGQLTTARTVDPRLKDGNTIIAGGIHRDNQVSQYVPVYSNHQDILIIPLPADRIVDALTSEQVSEKTKATLREITAGMTEAEIFDMNPVLQFLYLKKQ